MIEGKTSDSVAEKVKVQQKEGFVTDFRQEAGASGNGKSGAPVFRRSGVAA
jgi:hypothetical protein